MSDVLGRSMWSLAAAGLLGPEQPKRVTTMNAATQTDPPACHTKRRGASKALSNGLARSGRAARLRWLKYQHKIKAKGSQQAQDDLYLQSTPAGRRVFRPSVKKL